MYKFIELNQNAKNVAVEGFMKDAKSIFDMEEMNTVEVEEFLSLSRVHRYNDDGILIGKIRKNGGVESFEPSGMY